MNYELEVNGNDRDDSSDEEDVLDDDYDDCDDDCDDANDGQGDPAFATQHLQNYSLPFFCI